MTGVLTCALPIYRTYVPDPYYEGHEGFELVLDLLEDACEGLLEDIKNEVRR